MVSIQCYKQMLSTSQGNIFEIQRNSCYMPLLLVYFLKEMILFILSGASKVDEESLLTGWPYDLMTVPSAACWGQVNMSRWLVVQFRRLAITSSLRSPLLEGRMQVAMGAAGECSAGHLRGRVTYDMHSFLSVTSAENETQSSQCLLCHH